MALPPMSCLSLRGSVERRERLTWRLKQLGLLERMTFRLLDGADVTGLDPDAAKAARAADNFSQHLRSMREWLGGPAEHSQGLILCEDDLMLHRDFVRLAEAAFDNLPPGAPCLLLGHLLADDVADLVWAGVEPERHNLCQISHATWGLHCYWVSEDYARRLVAQWGDLAPAELPEPPECLTIPSGGFTAWPSLGIQDAAPSTIRPTDDMHLHVAGQPWPRSDYVLDGEDPPEPVGIAPPRRTIGLSMIVRDEAAVIERCLDSVRDLIDHWTICDTGSTDDTPQLTEQALDGIPGQVHHREWVDFGHNRTEALELARGHTDYLLLIDADQTVEIRGPMPPLVADSYLLRHSGDVDYAIPRLVRADRPWRYQGSTHEYLTLDGDQHRQTLPALVINHHGDGGSKADKFERDHRLLERDLAAHPDDERATFYLAQTLRDLGHNRRATELYRRRVELGGWDEEVFYAAFQVGALLAREDDDEAIAALLAAWELRPTRAEPLHELARFQRIRGAHHSALMLARSGLEIPPPDDNLFVHRDVYRWGLAFEVSISAFYAGEVEEALEAGRVLLASDDLPGEMVATVRENVRHCLVALGHDVGPEHAEARELSELFPSAATAEVRLDLDDDWAQFNPTIAPDGDGFRLVVRSANYTVDGASYVVRDGESAVRTRNYLVGADAGLGLRTAEPIVDRSAGPPTFPSLVQGHEDIRLIEVGGRWYGLAAVRDRNPASRCEMALLGLDGPRVTRTTILAGPEPGRDEKNWMPFVRDGRLLLVYSSSPARVLECDPDTGALQVLSERPGPRWAAGLRGGSQGVDVPGGTLFCVHEVLFADGRTYRHRLVLLDDELRLAGISGPFSFSRSPIEMCTGMAADGEHLVLAFGIEDRIAGLARIRRDEALAALSEPTN
ncbi:glycosyltransferase [Thermoleophilia bacterium SCSIO 60948]|nr:glycosyltransferase [Thermoleophilia bacterium SCSIO 60948]